MLVVKSVPAFAPYLDTPYLQRLADAVLAGEGITAPYEISLVITDDDGIRAINKQYRGLDAATDVLSFSLLADQDEPFVTPPGETLQLGDIIISYQRCIAQARELRHSVRRELGELFVHGLLHILAYDHDQEPDATVMAAKSEHYLTP